jgi:RNA polymerase sigma-70 factor (ECF subfamily)
VAAGGLSLAPDSSKDAAATYNQPGPQQERPRCHSERLHQPESDHPAPRLASAAARRLNAGMIVSEPLPGAGPGFADLLVAVAERQDRAAFATLFGHFAPRLKAYIRRCGLEEARAEELAQEVMLIVWRRAALYDPTQATASTWIFAIARNKRIDALRRERRPELDPDDPALVPDEDPVVDLLIAQHELEGRLRVAVDALPEEQAIVLRKNFFEDKPHNQIAAELALPLGTVKSRLRLALAKLRQAMRGID